MKRVSRLVGALLVAASSACAPVDSSNDSTEPEAGESRAAITPGTCGGARWIGVALPCPTVPGWNESQLFPGAGAPLDDYCAFDFAGPGAPGPNDIGILKSSGIALLAEDCPVAVPQSPSVDATSALDATASITTTALVGAPTLAATPATISGAAAAFGGAATLGGTTTPPDVAAYEEELARSLRQSFRAGVGGIGMLEMARGKRISPARVALIDTAPDTPDGGSILLGNDRHGDTLAGIVSDIGCDGAGCQVEITSALGMPWLDESTYTSAGGHVGRLSDVALAIHRAVRSASDPRLVINLSLGWEDAPGLAECSDDRSALLAPARAVYDVIEAARCNGALVVAAAGNDAGGPNPPSGLVCPARWEANAINACPALAGAPLLHAAGGVDHAGEPIAVTRPMGRPRVNALAFGGIGWQDGTPIPPPLTGTSVAAAVTSGIAALVWTHQPHLSADQVMDALYVFAAPAGVADTCPAGVPAPCDARVVSVCPALAAAGVVTYGCAPAPTSLNSSPILAPSVTDALSVILAGTPEVSVTAVPIDPAVEIPRFTAPSPALGGGAFPEPVVPLCPDCILEIYATSSNVLYARPSTCLDRPTLVLEAPGLRAAATLSLSTPLAANTSYRFQIAGAPAGVTRAWISGYTEASGATSVTQEIVLR